MAAFAFWLYIISMAMDTSGLIDEETPHQYHVYESAINPQR